MPKNKKISGSNMGPIKPANRTLRLLRPDIGLATSIVLKNNNQMNVSEGYRKEIRNAVLQAEYRKARARYWNVL